MPAGGGDGITVTVRQAAMWALAVVVALAVWFGPPVLHTLWLVGAGVYILVCGPHWQRLWLVTILGALLVVFGLAYALLLVTT